ncbi:polyadenylate-binding protein 1-B-like isoform X2 [Corticium candelabrum]|uniref:polyadenylate-binding protein 1-B-like isoform X2 n=1 Tax=Corticium candelabrum TaxID=121492 RepID=UPI002E25F102|nr:polyadenylate-binding protein 1-B-like isoform X2 [Corticium candelabrum]
MWTGQAALMFTTVYVKNFGEDFNEEEMREMFGAFGSITSLEVMFDQGGKSCGFGFVSFETHEGAARAVEEMNGKEINGRVIYAGQPQKQAERMNELRSRFELMKMERMKRFQGVNLYIKTLDDEIDNGTLRKEFSPYGTITSAKVMMDQQGRSRGFGFVCFSSPEEATKAVTEMNGRIIISKPLYVALAQCKEERCAQLTQQYMQRMQQQRPFFQTFPPQAARPRAWNQQQLCTTYAPFSMMAQQHRAAANRMMRPLGPRSPFQQQRGDHFPGQRRFVQQPARATAYRYTPGVHNPPAVPAVPPSQQSGPNPQQGIGQVGSHPPLTSQALSEASPQEQKQMLGERLYPLICETHPELAGKITGMLLEIDNAELLHMLDEADLLKRKVDEAVNVLRAHQIKEQTKVPSPDDTAYPYTPGVRNPPAVPAVQVGSHPPLTSQALSEASPQKQKQMLGERLYPLICETHPELAGRITGMLLEIDNAELLHMLDEADLLKRKVDEAVNVLRAHQIKEQTKVPSPGDTAYPYTPGVRNPPAVPAVQVGSHPPLTSQALSEASPQKQKQMLGERLYPLICETHPELAGRITGMLLEIDNAELLHMLDEADLLKRKVDEAVNVLRAHQIKEQTKGPSSGDAAQ